MPDDIKKQLDYPSVSAEGPEPRIGGLSALRRFNRRITEDQWLSVKLIAQRTALRRCLGNQEKQWDLALKLVSDAPLVAGGSVIAFAAALWIFINWIYNIRLSNLEAQNKTLETHRKFAEDQAKIANAELTKLQQSMQILNAQIEAQADSFNLTPAANKVSLYLDSALKANNEVQARLSASYPITYGAQPTDDKKSR